MKYFPAFALIVGFLMIFNGVYSKSKKKKQINYQTVFTEDVKQPSSLGYAIAKVSKPSAPLVVAQQPVADLSAQPQSPLESAIPFDQLEHEIQTSPRAALPELQKLTSVAGTLASLDRRKLILTLQNFQQEPEAADMAVAVFESHRRTPAYGDAELTHAMRSDALKVVIENGGDAGSALGAMMNLLGDEQDLGKRNEAFRAYLNLYPNYRRELLSGLTDLDMQYARALKQTEQENPR
jgi:hypothetical protein